MSRRAELPRYPELKELIAVHPTGQHGRDLNTDTIATSMLHSTSKRRLFVR